MLTQASQIQGRVPGFRALGQSNIPNYGLFWLKCAGIGGFSEGTGVTSWVSSDTGLYSWLMA